MKNIILILALITLASCSSFKGVVQGEQYKVYDVYLNNPNKYSFKYKVEVYLLKQPNANTTYFMTNDSAYYPGEIVYFDIDHHTNITLN
jgi:hypothetical protein